MKRHLITLLCLLSFTGCAYAELYQVPGSVTETNTQVNVSSTQENDKAETKSTKRKWFRKKRKDYNPTNSYWNFGRPPFWTGTY